MARPPQITTHELGPLIRARAPISATQLAGALGVNRTTILRALAGFGDDLVALGATRSTRYALRRQVLNAGSSWPIYALNEVGRAELWVTLEALHDRLWRVIWADKPPLWADRFSSASGLWEGFPFFLGDIRPQGFLGRAIAGRMARLLSVPEDPRRWSDDHALLFLQAAGEDVPGALVVGDACLRQAHARASTPEPGQLVTEAERSERYPELARAAMDSFPGSSAGGEQPKFLTAVTESAGDIRPVLVKFSPPLDQPTGRRWADLMVCECLALEVLSEDGHARSGARILDAGNRRFLEVPRFDRVGLSGRRGVVSLAALHPDAESFGSQKAWLVAAQEMLDQGLIDAKIFAAITRRHAFGELIGNTDMHAGNLGFWLDDTLPFQLAPAYDMLPMLWAPVQQGEIVDRSFVPASPLPAFRSEWRQASKWAEDFWDRATNDSRLSDEFSGIAGNARDSLNALRKREG